MRSERAIRRTATSDLCFTLRMYSGKMIDDIWGFNLILDLIRTLGQQLGLVERLGLPGQHQKQYRQG